MSNNHVVSIVQDKYGYMWFATRNGLNRYDGNKFKHYKNIPGDSTSLCDNDVNCLYFVNDSNLLIGTDKGLCLYNDLKDNFLHIRIDSNFATRSVRCIIEDSDKKLWIGSLNGIDILEPNKYAPYLYSIIKHLTRDNNNPNSIMDNMLNCIFEDSKKRIWIGTPEGLSYYNKYNEVIINYHYIKDSLDGISSSNILTVFEDESGFIWIGTAWNGLNRIHVNDAITPSLEFTHFYQQQGLYAGKIRSMYQDGDKRLWVGTHKGLYVYNEENNVFNKFINELNDIDYLNDKSVMCITEDKDGNMWIGTSEGGINCFNNRLDKFHSITFPANEIHTINPVKCITQDKNGTIWIGTKRGGLYYISKTDGKLYKFKNHLALSDESIESIIVDKNNHIWIANLKALYMLEPNNGKIEFILKTNFIIKNLYEDSKEQLWICTLGHKFYILNKSKRQLTRPFALDSILRSYSIKNVNAIIEEKKNIYWLATDKGLIYYNSVSTENHLFQYDMDKVKSIGSEGVVVLFMDDSKNLWIGTSNGLYLKNKAINDFLILGEDHGLSDNLIRGILQDNNSNLWISTASSISKLSISANKKENNLFQNVKNIISEDLNGDNLFENFRFIEGLPGNEFIARACLKTISGELLFGGTNGMAYFNPDYLSFNKTIPEIVLTEFYIFNQPVEIYDNKSPLRKRIDFTKQLKLKHYQNTFSFEFSSLNYINPEKNRFKCILYGYDNERDGLIDLGTKNIKSYSKVPPGKYVFKVVGSNNDGYWNETGKTINIRILPPPWKTWWAYTLYTLVLIFLVTIVTRLLWNLRVTRFERDNIKQLEFLKARFFTNISHELKNPITLIKTPLDKIVEEKKFDLGLMRVMQRNADRLMKLVNQILDFRKIELGLMTLNLVEVNLEQFIKDVIQSFNSIVQQKNIQVKFYCINNGHSVWIDSDKMEKVLYNILSNAFRYTNPNGLIEVNMKYFENESDKKGLWARIQVKDTGVGINKEYISKIFDRFYQTDMNSMMKKESTGIGLSYTKELINLHYGNINVDSKTGQNSGTSFTIEIPVSKDFYANKTNIVFNESVMQKYSNKEIQIEENITSNMNNNIDFYTILIIEDNKDLRQILKHELSSKFNIIEAEDGAIGFTLAIKHQPDIIISDIVMPEVNGYEFLSKLRTDEQTSHIPVIILTALSSFTSRIKGLETGADAYITKPFNFKELLITINDILENRKLLQEYYNRKIREKPVKANIASFDEIFVTRAIEYIEDNIENRNLSVENLASFLNVSVSVLFNKLKSLTGKSGKDFIQSIRLKRASELLADNKVTVAEVAYKTGFSDPNYFRKCFKKHFYTSPREFRDSN